MLLTHWVKFEPKFHAQIFTQMHNLFPMGKANKRQPIEDTITPLSFQQ
jgi:hypothetical protein